METTVNHNRSQLERAPTEVTGSRELVVTRRLTSRSSSSPTVDATHALREEIAARFEIIRELGSGGFGRVFLARDLLLDRLVAVKAVRSRHPTDAGRDRCLAEARAIARLRHPAIVSIYDVKRHGNFLLILLEYVQGTTLRNRLMQGPLAPEDAARILIQVADAVHFSHENGIIHCDLKPENILLEPDDTVKVTDFGCALLDDLRAAEEGQPVGTPAYMAPAQVQGRLRERDGRVDVWALGVILYEALTGHRPFTGSSASEVFDQVLYHDPAPLQEMNKGIPPELASFCMRCLQKNIDERLSTAQDFRDELEQFLTATEQPRYHIRPVTGTIATLVCAAVTTAGMWLGSNGLEGPSSGQSNDSDREAEVASMASTADAIRPRAVSLLRLRPEPLVFEWDDPAEHEYRYSPIERHLKVRTRRWAVFSLGETPGGDFALHCKILFKPDPGKSKFSPSHMGVFWGLSPHQDPEEGRQLIAPAVSVTHYGSAHELEACLAKFTLRPFSTAPYYVRDLTRSTVTKVRWHGGQPVSFQVYVQSGRLTSVAIGGHRIEQNLIPPRYAAWRSHNRGRLGVALLGGEFTVVDAVLIPGQGEVTHR